MNINLLSYDFEIISSKGSPFALTNSLENSTSSFKCSSQNIL